MQSDLFLTQYEQMVYLRFELNVTDFVDIQTGRVILHFLNSDDQSQSSSDEGLEYFIEMDLKSHEPKFVFGYNLGSIDAERLDEMLDRF